MKNKHKNILIAILITTGILFSLSAYGESDEDTEKLIRAASQGYFSNTTNKTFQELLYPVAEKNNTSSQNSSSVIYVSSDDIAVVDALVETQEDEKGYFDRFLDLLNRGYDYVTRGLEWKERYGCRQKEERNLKAAEGKRGENITVAIIDTGRLNTNYPSLDAEKLWINMAEIANDDIDNDKNGYVDDIYGWDFVRGNNNQNNNGVMDKFTIYSVHPAECANCVLEVAPESKIMFLRVGIHLNLHNMIVNHNQNVYSLAAINPAVIYATDNGAKMISISLRDSIYKPENQKAIDYAHSKDVIIVASAGNDNSNVSCYPAAYNNVITVAGILSGKRWPSSNYGDYIDIAAPVDFDNGVGTSFSAPRVAGAAAFLRSEQPSLNATQITNILYNTADDIEPAGWDPYTGYGELNLTAALQTVRSLPNLNSSERNLILNQLPQKYP